MRLPRWLWITLLVLALLVMFAIGPGEEFGNALVHSDAFRHEVETRASASANGTVQIKEIQFSVWRGIRLCGVVLKTETPQGTVAAKVESVNCSYSLFALLRREVQLRRVTLEDPEVELTQEPPSKVPLPAAKGGNKPASAPAEPAKVPPLQVVLDSAKVTDGHLTIHDASGTVKADLQKVHVYADTGGYYSGGDVTGTISIGKIALPKNLALTDFNTPFKGHVGTMEADPFEAAAFGGRITGHYHLEPGSASTLDVAASDLDVARISKTANPGSATTLSGSLGLQSSWHGVETGTLTGEGDAQITHGKLQGVAALNNLASLFHIRGLADPALHTVTVHFEVAGGATRFSHLVVASDDFDLTGDGAVAPSGALDANLVITLHGGAMGGVSGLAAALLSRVPGGGNSIPVHITGTVSDPHTNISPQILNPAPKVEKGLKAISHLF